MQERVDLGFGGVARFELDRSKPYSRDKWSEAGDLGNGGCLISHGGFEKKSSQEVQKPWLQRPFLRGKHQFMSRGDLKVRAPNPHGSGEISASLLREILRQAGISEEEWDEV